MRKLLVFGAGAAVVVGALAPAQTQAQAAPQPAPAALAPSVMLCGISYYGDYRTWIDQTGKWSYRHTYTEAKAVLKTHLSYTGFIQHHGQYDSDNSDCGEWWVVYRDTGSTW